MNNPDIQNMDDLAVAFLARHRVATNMCQGIAKLAAIPLCHKNTRAIITRLPVIRTFLLTVIRLFHTPRSLGFLNIYAGSNPPSFENERGFTREYWQPASSRELGGDSGDGGKSTEWDFKPLSFFDHRLSGNHPFDINFDINSTDESLFILTKIKIARVAKLSDRTSLLAIKTSGGILFDVISRRSPIIPARFNPALNRLFTAQYKVDETGEELALTLLHPSGALGIAHLPYWRERDWAGLAEAFLLKHGDEPKTLPPSTRRRTI